MKKATNSTLTHGESRFPKGPHFHEEQFYSRLTHSALKQNKNVKNVNSQRLCVNYTVTIHKYNKSIGELNPELKQMMDPPPDIQKRYYYKEYSNLKLDVHRSPKQIERWNCLTKSTLNHEYYHNKITSIILDTKCVRTPHPALFKQIQHLPEKHSGFEKRKRHKRRIKNWIRRNRKRNKLKKQFPPLPPGTPGDLRIYTYYKNTYNINLFDYKVRKRFDPNPTTTSLTPLRDLSSLNAIALLSTTLTPFSDVFLHLTTTHIVL
ncbi:hypothetical protein RirG_120600 [Rhizophagus irregularis DAOM 197198w]|nr:hypothetical protein RirG_120600 [Rhizophagus irregularis DAOM 197198w]